MVVREGLVSVIIPTYNRSTLCKNAVESVLSQTYENLEVIVVDDGSTDETAQTISNLDGRVKYIWQANSGVSASRNRGMELAEGEFIAFLDSDDTWLPWKLDAQLSVLRAFSECGMVWTDMVAVGENGETISESYLERMYGAYQYFDREKHFRVSRNVCEVWNACPGIYARRKCYSGNIFSWMFMGNLVHTSTVLLRRDRQKQVGLFDVGLIKSGEDYDFHFRTCRSGDVAYLDVPSILYRVGAADQLTQREYMGLVARNNLITIKKMLSSARDEIRLPPAMIRRRLADSYFWVGMEEFSSDPASARKHFWKGLMVDPLRGKAGCYLILSYLPQSHIEVIRGCKNKLANRRKRLPDFERVVKNG